MPILKRGSKGPDLLAIHQRLKELGFDPNGVDGNFGPGTEAAVRAFQKANRLPESNFKSGHIQLLNSD